MWAKAPRPSCCALWISAWAWTRRCARSCTRCASAATRLFAFADRLEARLAQAQAAATRLTPALLAKAFRGELVPQDPNDEPAAELLRRLQAERASAPKASAGRGRKAVVQSEG